MKKCTLCKKESPYSEFNKRARSKDGLQNVCRTCNQNRSRKYYADNVNKHRQTIKVRQASQKLKLRNIILKIKQAPCTDCKVNYPYYVMDFDHVRGTKKYDISSMASRGGKIEHLLDEISKCELVCSNCHRIRTWNRLQENKLPSSMG